MRISAQPSVPRAGMLAAVRNRRGVVAGVEPFDGEAGRLHLVHLEYRDDHAPAEERLLWELEPSRHHYEEIREQLQRERTRVLERLLPTRFALAGEAQGLSGGGGSAPAGTEAVSRGPARPGSLPPIESKTKAPFSARC